MKTTLKDIARECQVGLGTVSDILNDNGKYKRETRQKVLEAVERLNYKPRHRQSLLVQRKTKVLGLVVPNTSAHNSFLNSAIRYFNDQASASQVESLLYNQSDIEQRLADAHSETGNPFPCDGLIFFAPQLGWENLVKKVRDRKIPCVLVRRSTKLSGVPVINDSDYKGAWLAMEHLFGLGHSRFGLLYYASRFMDGRKHAFEAFLKGQGLVYKEEFTYSLYQQDKGPIEQWLDNVLAAPDAPTAFFCFDDHDALVLINILREYNIRVPAEIAVVGYDNDPMGRKLHPYLTTVEIPAREMITLACKSLLGFLDGGPVASMKIELENKLIIRESCGAK